MKSIHLRLGYHLHAFSDSTHASKVMGRALISLIAFLMVAMMWTERFLTWDRFLQGGQDLELSLVALVVFLCLIILLAQKSQQAVALHLAVCRLLSGIAGSARKLMASKHLSFIPKTAHHGEILQGLFGHAPFYGCGISPLRI